MVYIPTLHSGSGPAKNPKFKQKPDFSKIKFRLRLQHILILLEFRYSNLKHELRSKTTDLKTNFTIN